MEAFIQWLVNTIGWVVSFGIGALFVFLFMVLGGIEFGQFVYRFGRWLSRKGQTIEQNATAKEKGKRKLKSPIED